MRTECCSMQAYWDFSLYFNSHVHHEKLKKTRDSGLTQCTVHSTSRRLRLQTLADDTLRVETGAELH